MRYRERFHLSYQQFLETPWEVFVQDLEMLDIEAVITNGSSAVLESGDNYAAAQ